MDSDGLVTLTVPEAIRAEMDALELPLSTGPSEELWCPTLQLLQATVTVMEARARLQALALSMLDMERHMRKLSNTTQ